MKILQTGDWHISDKNIEESKKCLEFLVETARKENPDIIINSGDTYDVGGTKLDSLSAKLVFEIVQKLGDIAPVTIITGTRSHDSTAVEVLRYVRSRNEVFVSTTPEQIYLMPGEFFATNPGDTLPILAISQIPTPTKQYFKSSGSIDSTNQEIASAMGAIFGGFGVEAAKHDCPHVLSGHFSVSGAFLSATRQMVGFDIEVSSDHIALANADLVALSHIHVRQQIQKNIFYSGSLFQSDTSEAGQDFGFWIHELDDAHRLQKSEYIITPFTRLYKFTHDLTNSPDTFQVPFKQETLDQIKGAVVKVEITAYEDDVAKIDREDLNRNLAETKSFEIKIIRTPRENVRSEKLLKLKTLREKIIEQARLRSEEVPESILVKTDNLESMEVDEIVSMVAK